ncbi:SDR family oxidoreductase [Phyllobacterium sp. 628]|uniref:NAD(P)-dependent oxidoreductase n=1 Tax=Phyllobacterium sp. 628 TaxID=2718938 RepID=UPI0016625F5E|nr:NAD(P)-binding oxidoreductase [Phyllobacterium sp. 628]QND53251.1 SDR family oxidoreductase [Phyllobacterium sp. 628]
MTVLVVGASGATGRLVVGQLLGRGMPVRAIIRPQSSLPDNLSNRKNLTIIRTVVSDLTDADMAQHVKGCDAILSCLGHNMSFKGIYGQPRRLVADATRRLCKAVITGKPQQPVKFVLMNTAGNSNRDLSERVSWAEKCVIGLVRLLVPPHADNEKAADFLRVEIGQTHPDIEWAAVRPDSLTNADAITDYDEHPSPIRSAIFNPGSTSRINVAHFMAELVTNPDKWRRWKGQMPVIYNRTACSASARDLGSPAR